MIAVHRHAIDSAQVHFPAYQGRVMFITMLHGEIVTPPVWRPLD